MRRLFFVPQYPTNLRYQEWWFKEIPYNLSEYFDDKVVVLGSSLITNPESKLRPPSFGEFSVDPTVAMEFEMEQIKQFLLYGIGDDDYLFLSDISYPGLFANVLYHMPVKNAYAFCHATAINNLDYYWMKGVSDEKWWAEIAHFGLFKKVFVASEYHKDKLEKMSEARGWEIDNVEVIGFPPTPDRLKINTDCTTQHEIISVARMNPQKVDIELELQVERALGIKIERTSERNLESWEEYFDFISRSKVMLITSQEETFGIQVMDAIDNGCIPIAPKAFSYPELLTKDYLYKIGDFQGLLKKIQRALKDGTKLPQLQNKQLIENFYKLVAFHMGVLE